MLKKRMITLLMSVAMLLTFMPAMAFAEDNDGAASDPAYEAASDETSMENTSEKQDETQLHAKGAVVPQSGVFHNAAELWGYVGDDEIQGHNWWHFYTDAEEPLDNSIDVTFSNGETKTYKAPKNTDIFFLDGDENKEMASFDYDRIRLKEGKNTVSFYMYKDGKNYTLGTVEITGKKTKIDKLVYTQADPLEARLKKSGYADYYGNEGDEEQPLEPFIGDTVRVKAYSHAMYIEEDGSITEKDEPYEALYKCQFRKYVPEDNFESCEFWIEERISGEYRAPESINVKFWDDQKESKWEAGSTHEIIATLDGVEAEGKLVVNVKGSSKPHEHVAGDVKKVVVKEATCTKSGSYDEITYCRDCGEEMSRVSKTSKAAGHSLHKVAAKSATCKETGVKAHYECKTCGGMFKDAKGKKATTVKALTVKKKSHNFKKKNKSDEYLKSAATCTKPAAYYYTCTMCGEKGKKTFKSGKALGHDFVAGNITKATAKKDGKKASKCSRCGKTNKGVKIPKTSKVFSLNKKSVAYTGGGKEKDAISVRIKAGKFPLGSQEFYVVYGEPVYGKNGKGSGTVTVNFKPECKYYSGTLKLTYKITKVPKK